MIGFLSPDLLLRVPGERHQRLHLSRGELCPDKTMLLWWFPPGKYLRFVRRQILQNVLQNFGLHVMTVLWFFGYYFENIFTIFILAFEDQVRILLCVCLHHFLKNITPIFDNNCVLYCLYIFGNYVYCFCTHRRLKNTCSTRTFNINHYKAYFYCVNNEQLVALVNVLNKT